MLNEITEAMTNNMAIFFLDILIFFIFFNEELKIKPLNNNDD